MQNTQTKRNRLGQWLTTNAPVVLVTQTQGAVSIAVGRIEKFSKSGNPQIRYLDGTMSPPVQRWERLFVMDERQYDFFEERQRVVDDATHEFEVMHGEPRRYSDDWRNWTNERRNYVNRRLGQNGFDELP